MRLAFDTNILVYAEFEPDYQKGVLARRLLLAAADEGIIAAQAVGELFNVARRRYPALQSRTRDQVLAYSAVMAVVPSDREVLLLAAAFAERYQLQFWDAVIWQASAKGGATILLTEDLQHGFTAGGMRAVNPYVMPDWPSLTRELGIRG
jgi:predicted nucleic acid-binding protein